MVVVREEQLDDIRTVRIIHERAFGQPEEADIVDKLRSGCPGLLSLVAARGDQVVGHILFSPALIVDNSTKIEGMGLAPMAVLPEYQGQGIGSELVKTGIARLKAQGCPFIVVLGHAEYYPRFGFDRCSRYGIRSEWDVPDDAFMVLIMDQAMMSGISGVCKYRSEFDEDM